jgi:hypothetical protein
MEHVNTPELGEELLPAGSRIGAFRVVGCAGRGSYGTVYRVERVEPADPRPFVLELAEGTSATTSPGGRRPASATLEVFHAW